MPAASGPRRWLTTCAAALLLAAIVGCSGSREVQATPRDGAGPRPSVATPVDADEAAVRAAPSTRPEGHATTATIDGRIPSLSRPPAAAPDGDDVIPPRETALGAALVRRERLIRAAGKYPLRRVVDSIRRDAAGERVVDHKTMVADHVLVRLQPGADDDALRATIGGLGYSLRRTLGSSRSYLVSFPAGDHDALTRAIAALTAARAVVSSAEPDFQVHALIEPNDPSFAQCWGLENTGQSGGTPHADIGAPAAWDLATGSASVLVGVIDTGIDYTHPDLAANIWTNPGEIGLDANGQDKRTNGIDDDGDGYVDDWHGWDFVNDDNDPRDDFFHGTHVAGTIGASGDNGVGVCGVNWRVSLVPLKFLDQNGQGWDSDAVEAVAYATRMGVSVTSNSWSGGGYSLALKAAIDDAATHGILFVAAAGNDASDNDLLPAYPASYDCPNIISVAATDRYDALASFSNIGPSTVHLGAPGVDILSTLPTYQTAAMTSYGLSTGYGSISGTSMATPHVSGACALLKAYQPSLSAADIRERILLTAQPVPALDGKCLTGGRLELADALRDRRSVLLAGLARPLEYRVPNANGSTYPRTSTIDGVDIVGTAAGPDFARYVLEAGAGAAPVDWSSVDIAAAGGGTTPVMDGLLGHWSPSAALEGEWSLRLTVIGAAGLRSVTRIVWLDPHLKPGFPTLAQRVSTDYVAPLAVTIADLDGDGRPDIVAPLAAGPLCAYDWRGRMLPGWPAPLAGTHCAAGDVDGDGRAEVAVVTDGENGPWGLLDGTGAWLPGWPRATANYAALAPVLADVDGDGQAELLTDQENGGVNVARRDGSLLPGWPRAINGQSVTGIAVVGRSSTLAGTVFASDPTTVWAWHADGSALPGWPSSGGGSVAIGDVDGDGTSDIVIARMGRVDALHADGTSLPGWPRTYLDGSGTAMTLSRPALADLDGDGVPEVVVIAFSLQQHLARIDALRGDGSRLPGWPRDLVPDAIGLPPVVGDIDGDGYPDIVASLGSTLVAFHVDGSAVAGFPKLVLGLSPTATAPAIADLDGDGRNELVVLVDYANGVSDAAVGPHVYAWDFNAPGTVSGPIEWGQDGGDAAHSGSYRSPANRAPVIIAAATTAVDPVAVPASAALSVRAGDDGLPRRPGVLTYTWSVLSGPGGVAFSANGGTGDHDCTAVFSAPGDYALRVSVSDGALTTTSDVVAHVPPTTRPPTVRLTNPLPGQAYGAPATLLVTATAADPDGRVVAVAFFADGVALGTDADGSDGWSAPWSDVAPGTYALTAVATDDAGASTRSAPVQITVARAADAGGQWPMAGGDPAHDGYAAVRVGAGAFAKAWALGGLPWRARPVAIGGGRVYITAAGDEGPLGSANTTIIAVDAETGAEAWRYGGSAGLATFPAAYDAGRVFLQMGAPSTTVIGGSAPCLVALDATTGSPVWMDQIATQPQAFSPTVADGRVLVAGGRGMYGIVADDGSPVFSLDLLSTYGRWTPASAGGTAYAWATDANDLGSYFTAVDPSSGATRWSIALPNGGTSTNPMTTMPVIAGGMAYVIGATPQPTLYAIDLAARSVAWSRSDAFTGTPAVAGGVVYAMVAGGVQSYAATTGAPGLRYPAAGSWNCQQPVATDDALLVATTLFTYVFPIGDAVPSCLLDQTGDLAIAGRMLAIAGVAPDGTGYVYAYRLPPPDHAPQIADLHVSTAVGVPVPIVLTASDADGDALAWRIVDGPSHGSVSGAPPTFVYLPDPGYAGDDAIAVVAGDGETDSAIGRVSITVSAAADQPPIARIADAPAGGTAPLDVVFDGRGSSDADGAIVSYAWDFGDGRSATGPTAEHVFAQRGTYVVTLMAVDDGGAAGVATATVVAAAANRPPTARIASSASTGPMPLTVAFDGGGSSDADGSIVGYAWSFGDGTGASGATASHAFTDPGVYAVTLTVTDDRGATGTATASIAATDPGWTFVGGSWRDQAGRLSQLAWNSAQPKKALRTDRAYPDAVDILARVRIGGWTDLAQLRTGLGLATDAQGAGYGFVFGDTVSGRRIGFYDDSAGWGSTAPYAWETGTWYWLRLRRQPSGQLLGKVWADGSAEPAAWTLSQSGWTSRSGGAPALIGGSPATFDGIAFADVVNQPPVAQLSVRPATGSAPLPVDFDSSGSTDYDGQIVSYAWDFGDGASGTGWFTSHTYASAGTYVARLTVVDDGGAAATASTTIVVNPAGSADLPPVARIAATPTGGYAPVAIVFDGSGSTDADGSVIRYLWTFGDGTHATAQSLLHAFTAPGTYAVTLTVTDDGGLANIATTTVTVAPPPTDPAWTFVGGTWTASGGTLSQTSTLAGEKVALRKDNVFPDNVEIVARVRVDAWPASGGASAGVGLHAASGSSGYFLVFCDPTHVQFVNGIQSSSDPVAFAWQPAAWYWFRLRRQDGVLYGRIWADGTTEPTTWPYVQSGWSNVVGGSPALVDSSGSTGATATFDSVAIDPVVGAPQRPMPSIGVAPRSGPAPLAVSLSGLGSTDVGGYITGYAWDFGDGTTASGMTQTHVYANPGRYGASLVVTDDQGLTSSASTAFITVSTQVGAPPTAAIAATPTAGAAPLVVAFDGGGSHDSDGTIAAYAWSFGDGGTASGATATHVYAGVGTYAATLIVTDDQGETGAATTTITVAATNQPPIAVIGATPVAGAAPLAVSFDGGGSSDADGTIAAYAWDFGDGATAAGRTVGHTYASGSYTARLTVTDDAGATATASVAIAATPPQPPPPGGGTAITRQWWLGIPGTAVSDLTSDPAFPSDPSGSDLRTSFEAPIDWADDYGTRMAGFITAPVAGAYVFTISGDDNCELWLSPDQDPAHKARIASVPGWTNPREWAKYAEQRSMPITLAAGQVCYIEALHKEGGGGDNLAVAWQFPNGAIEAPIPGHRLSPLASIVGSTPFGGAARAVPGRIEAEDFDDGGEGVAYHDSDAGNDGGAYRATDVDIRACSDVGGGYQVGWTAPGEWLQYSVDVAADDTYALTVRVASGAAGATLHIAVDGVDATGPLTFGGTGGWDTWRDVVAPSVHIAAGRHLLRLVVDAGASDLNAITATPAGSSPYGGTARAIPGRIEAEDFDDGGEGVAYHDLDAANQGGAYRATGVDVYADGGAGNGAAVGWIAPGEWLDYTVDIASAGAYVLSARVALPGGGGRFHVECDGADVSGALAIPDTGGWNAYATISAGIQLPAGSHVLRVAFDAAGGSGVCNLDWIAFASGGSGIGTGTGLAAQYWTDQLATFDGAATLTRTDPSVDFDWGDGSPDASISNDRFTARWTGQVQAESTESYTFTVTGDDGVRLWVDGQLIVDAWYDQAPTDHSGSIALSAGQPVAIRMDYYENGGGAVARLSWSTPAIARQIVPRSQLYPSSPASVGSGLLGQYWSNQLAGFAGAPTVTRTDATVAFDWGGGSPDASVSSDRFTARWTGQIQAPASGTYTFTVTGDDGVRLWVAGQLLVDAWYDEPPTDHSGSIALTAGQPVPIQLDYYENGGGAVAKLSWSSSTIPPQIVPTSALFPTATTEPVAPTALGMREAARTGRVIVETLRLADGPDE